MPNSFKLSKNLISNFIIFIVILIIAYAAIFFLLNKNKYYISKLHVSATTITTKKHINEILNKNLNNKNLSVKRRQKYNTEFAKWNYAPHVIDTIFLTKDYNGKFLFKDDEDFFNKTVYQKIINNSIFTTLIENQYIKSSLSNVHKKHRSLIIYLGFSKEEDLNDVSKILTEKFKDQIIKDNKNCDIQNNKIDKLVNFKKKLIENNYSGIESDFIKKLKLVTLKKYNCKIYYFDKKPTKVVKRYNEYLILLFIIFFITLIIVPAILKIKK